MYGVCRWNLLMVGEVVVAPPMTVQAALVGVGVGVVAVMDAVVCQGTQITAVWLL